MMYIKSYHQSLTELEFKLKSLEFQGAFWAAFKLRQPEMGED